MHELVALPAFSDNYIWLLHDGTDAVVVDPGDAAVVAEALKARRLRLVGILVTHHHPDHTGGIEALRPLLHGPVWRSARESVPAQAVTVAGGETITALGLNIAVLEVPGHTAGHVAYHLAPPGQSPILFCGDTLFSAGCGRLFEGTAEQMGQSLDQLAALPSDTRVCCAHEYTLSNLRFAQAVEPQNNAVAQHIHQCQTLRAQGLPTLPSTIGLELDINPFLRTRSPAVQAAAQTFDPAARSPAEVLGALRRWKNQS